MKLRLVTYNIHKGIGGLDGRYRPQRIVEVLSAYDPDVVMMQEVDDGVPRSRRDRQVDLIGDALRLSNRAYQRNVELRTGHYGNAILSRFPLTDVDDVDLSLPLKKTRRALTARCRVGNASSKEIFLINCHLGLAGFERSAQLRRLLAMETLTEGEPGAPVIIAGDYNDVWGTLGGRFMEPMGFRSAAGRSRTFPAAVPVCALDRIFYRGGIELRRGFASRVRLAKEASDHLPLIADFEV